SIKNDGHYFCRAGGNRPDGLNEPVTMESRIYPVMSDIPALSDLITSMVASGYDYRRDDDAGLWSSADLTYVITYEM
ncbi:phage minor tail U family protein, partial [Escherichia coli]|uniref:phage minor tail U family protein n=1 Tax=Escherichia coli TaxID=562 RepID=UPI001E2B2CAF